MKLFRLFIIVASIVGTSCQNKPVDPELLSAEGDLLGSWKLYERGYSPGSGYTVEPVPDEPVQWIDFNANGTFQSNLAGMGNYKYYRVIDDPSGNSKIVALFESEPVNVDPSNLEHSYQMSFENGGLNLSFRFCIEGCHMAFRPLISAGE
jgi:hypothetical protein